MSNAVKHINKINTGLCPHGLPQGACPICSKMGGGSLRAGERPQKAGEMSYHECAMIGAMMRARALAQKQHEQNIRLHNLELQKFQESLARLSQKMIDFANRMSFILKPVSYTILNIVVPTINFVRNITNVIQNIGEKIVQLKEKLIDIQDKLNALFGEAKAFLEKKVSEIVSTLKKKLANIFKVFSSNNTKDDDTKIDEDKKMFNLRTILNKITGRKKKDDSKNKSGS